MMVSNINQKIFLVIFGSFLSQIVQVGVFPLFLSQKLDGLGVALSLIGWFVGIQWLAVLLIAPIAPRLVVKFGLEKLVLLSCIVTGAGMVLVLMDGVVFMAIASVLLGAGLILRWVACDALVVQMAESANIGRTIGFHEAMMGFGIAAGPITFIWLQMDHIIYLMLFLVAFSGVAFGVAGYRDSGTASVSGASLERKDFLIIQIVLLLALVGGLIETASVAFLPFYFEADGFSLMHSAWFVSGFGLGGTLLQLPLGYVADVLGHGRAQLISCIVALFAFAGLYMVSSDFWIVYFTLFVLGGAVGAFNTLAVIQAGCETAPEKTASVMTYIAMAYTFGGIVGPIITASILDLLPADAILVAYSTIVIVLVFAIAFSERKSITL